MKPGKRHDLRAEVLETIRIEHHGERPKRKLTAEQAKQAELERLIKSQRRDATGKPHRRY